MAALWKDFNKNINFGKTKLIQSKKTNQKKINYTEGNHKEYQIGIEPNKPNIVINGITALHLKYIDYNTLLYKNYVRFLKRLKKNIKYEYMDQ